MMQTCSAAMPILGLQTAEDNYTVNDDGEVVVASLDHSNADESV
jgi:hypothetical protein